MRKLMLISFFLVYATLCTAQLITLKSTILSTEDKSPLAYANVYSKRLKTGTAANLLGYFELPNNKIGDTIEVSYLGYVSRRIIITDQQPRTILLSRSPGALTEVVVTAEDDYLYELVSAARKNNETAPRSAKTYLYLETLLEGAPVEIIEAYYNGAYRNYGVENLKYKKGRIGLKPVNQRYYSSTESSRLFSLHDVFSKNYHFPDNPLCLNLGTLKRKYELALRTRFVEDETRIVAIDFRPKKPEGMFSGTVWIDEDHRRLLKLKLKIEDSKKHPFTPIGFNTIQDVDMDITRSYARQGKELYLNTIDFSYSVAYQDPQGAKLEARTTAYSKAYDYKEAFNLPWFKFTKSFHEDYRNMTFPDYDESFWDNTTEFRFYDRLQTTDTFIRNNRLQGNIIRPESDEAKQQLQWPYIRWSKDRFKMNEAPISKIEPPPYIRRFANERFKLNVKLFFDVNVIADSLTFQLMSILDPVETFYYFYLENSDHAFMNMYFDLMEIQQREMRAELLLLSHPTKDELDAIYHKYTKEFENKAKLFLSETKRGTRLENMKEWSDYIYDHLAVDNVKIFGLEEPKIKGRH